MQCLHVTENNVRDAYIKAINVTVGVRNLRSVLHRAIHVSVEIFIFELYLLPET